MKNMKMASCDRCDATVPAHWLSKHETPGGEGSFCSRCANLLPQELIQQVVYDLAGLMQSAHRLLSEDEYRDLLWAVRTVANVESA